ncbi:MAG: hypothetical protein ABIN48_03240, partial [Ginsengibacter sp.]
MRKIYIDHLLSSTLRSRAIALTLSCFVFVVGMMPVKSFATNYTGTWTSVAASPTCAGATANYTLNAKIENDANAAIAVGKAVEITFPAGFGLSGSTGTMNGATIGTITTTGSTVSFNVPNGGEVAAN